ncbi:MAG: hypothetical protein HN742_22345 [Lentisphaerae bacterium]|jgi:hypothetical protein|nr:hypothetical protein [Lentisphaerota bacterium]MBT4814832.1 hypothetical protein [Lentisphaerota bacterium]MBT5604961.1 hypothetical protein [Lentisphaerota bacterium]MBT7055971.1 hypothetical protein [Lentisphaerota bacterium]MBT7844634.1 hypothetical protein [Lentisphaerota bacterium]
MNLRSAVLIVLGVSVAGWVVRGETVLRHDCFAVAKAVPGSTLLFQISSSRKAKYVYMDAPRAIVLGVDSGALLEQAFELGATADLSVSVKQAGIHGLCLELGQNTATLAVPRHPWALVARKQAPLHICGRVDPLYFRPPVAGKSFRIFVHAPVAGEAALVRITDPEGEVVVFRENDFDKAVGLEFAVAEGTAGRDWRLEILAPEKGGWALDDVTIWLGQRLQPLLAVQAAHLSAFAGVGARAPEKIRTRVPIGEGIIRLGRGDRKTVAFELDGRPDDPAIALRMLATDVDYRNESPVFVNGHRFFLPVTGDGLTGEVTLRLPPDVLREGHNLLEFRQDPSGGSGACSVARIELLFGTAIHAE